MPRLSAIFSVGVDGRIDLPVFGSILGIVFMGFLGPRYNAPVSLVQSVPFGTSAAPAPMFSGSGLLGFKPICLGAVPRALSLKPKVRFPILYQPASTVFEVPFASTQETLFPSALICLPPDARAASMIRLGFHSP